MIVPERLAKFEERVTREIDNGLLPACQWAFGLDGEIVASGVLGDATEDTRFTIFSATKALVASTVWTCIAEGSIKIDARVADMIPEFATNGKQDITIEQVMLHTSGFPRNGWDLDMATSEGRRKRFAQWKTNWDPGTRYEYHATTAHWVLAELLEVATGQNFLDVIEQRVTTPLGLPRILGIPKSDDDNIATLHNVGEEMSPDELEATFGVRALPVTEVTPEALVSFNEPARRALGVVIAGDDGKANMRGFGHTQSPRSFGHNGAGGQIAFVDPESGLSFVYLTNGLDRHMVRQARRSVALASIAAEVTQPL